jgi:hypothetical protein
MEISGGIFSFFTIFDNIYFLNITNSSILSSKWQRVKNILFLHHCGDANSHLYVLFYNRISNFRKYLSINWLLFVILVFGIILYIFPFDRY